jgi:hypothetical protein
MLLTNFLAFGHQLIQQNSVRDRMQNDKREEQSDSAYEVSVIGLADAVIDPQTVVVEHIHTPVALATVF